MLALILLPSKVVATSLLPELMVILSEFLTLVLLVVLHSPALAPLHLTSKTIDGLETTPTEYSKCSVGCSSITINGDVIPLGGNATVAGGGGGGSGDVTLNGVQSLTNKTISGNLNTLTNIAKSSIKQEHRYISINGTQVELGGTLTLVVLVM